MRARVIVLAGPSGSGKSHLTDRTGLPVLRLDDFYKDGADPSLPRIALAGGEPIVDWDDPASWNAAAAVAALEELCRTGRLDAPIYDIATSRQAGHRVVELGSAAYVVAEGIFAQEIVDAARARGLLADALCVTQHPARTFVRRLSRDLREHRKPPWVLLRRGLHLLAAQRAVVAHARQQGCRVVSPAEARATIAALASSGG
ncbi:MAG: ATP-binding protein [Marmoricola sp.]